MELFDLKVLVEISKHDTLKEAANALFLSQSSLSKTIDRLESEFKVKLFGKEGNKIVLNKNGKLVVNVANEIIDKISNLKEEIIKNNNPNRYLNIGVCSFSARLEISNLCHRIYKDSTITIDIKNNIELLKGLYKHEYDMIVLPYDISNDAIECAKLFEDGYKLLVPINHKLAYESSISLNKIDGENFVIHPCFGYWIDTISDKLFKSNITICNDYFKYYDLIQYSDFLSFITEKTISVYGNIKNKVSVQLNGDISHVSYYCICLEENKEVLSELFASLSGVY